MKKTDKILVTGASGFIGSRLIKSLWEQGYTNIRAVTFGRNLREDFKLEEMKPLFMTKGTANKYYPYILTLTERDYHEVIAKGDGSKAEDISKSVKVDVKYIKSLNPSDLITDYMLMKIKEYLNQ